MIPFLCSAEHMKLYEENMKRFLDELAALTPAPKKVAV
jgi:hypothetical protein